jgi:hypothetical protein
MAFDLFSSEEVKLAIAGFCGAMVYSVLHPAKSLREAFGQIPAGLLCSYYGTPLVMAYTGIDVGLTYPVAFLVGLFGLAVAGGLMWSIEKYDFAALLPKRKAED